MHYQPLLKTHNPHTFSETLTIARLQPRENAHTARFFVELRVINASLPLSQDIAWHLYSRLLDCDKAIIITDKPLSLLAVLRKQWLKLMRQVQRKRSETLDTQTIATLSQQFLKMGSMTFAAGSPLKKPGADILITTPQELREAPQIRRTLYATCQWDDKVLLGVMCLVPHGGLVVLYRQNG